MQRIVVELLRPGDLDDRAEVHDGDPVGDMPDDRQVVGDEEEGEVELVLQVLEQVDDLGLDRDVEGGNGLVGDDEVGIQRQRAGEADPLALAARELVRIARGRIGRQADDLEQLANAPRRLAPAREAVRTEWLTDDPPHAMPWVQGRKGSWKTICMRRRSGRSSSSSRCVMSWPSKKPETHPLRPR